MSEMRRGVSDPVHGEGTGQAAVTITNFDDDVARHFCLGAASKGAVVGEDARTEVRGAFGGEPVDRRWWRVAGPRVLVLVRLAGRLAAAYAEHDATRVIAPSHAKQALAEAGILAHRRTHD